MRRCISACVTAIVLMATLAGVSPSAQAATTDYPVRSFDLTYGATYTRGTVTFYNRSVRVQGVQRAVDPYVSGCRTTQASTFEQIEFSKNTCNGVDDYTIDLTADQAGGASWVDIRFFYVGPNDEYKVVAYKRVYR